MTEIVDNICIVVDELMNMFKERCYGIIDTRIYMHESVTIYMYEICVYNVSKYAINFDYRHN